MIFQEIFHWRSLNFRITSRQHDKESEAKSMFLFCDI